MLTATGSVGVSMQGSEPAREIAVELKSVGKRFANITALHSISMSVAHGEFVTLLGPSGCGKTTLLNLVAGFFSPSSGRNRVDGRLVNDVPTYKREVGIMFQNYALFPHMSVANNVAYGLKMRGFNKGDIGRRVNDILALVKLSGYEERKPRQLSGGQQQRVALARALVINPRVLLLDEPFSALDKNLRRSMQVELREIQRQLGVTTIFVTHDQAEALSLSDRVAVMSEGQIRQVGTPEEVYSKPHDRFVASFVGDANILQGRFEGLEGDRVVLSWGKGRISTSRASLPALAPAAAVDIFVRPEQVVVSDPGEREFARGTVAARVFQGGYIDLYVEIAGCASARLLARLAARDVGTRWPPGAEVGISLTDGGGVSIFPSV